jgi:uncharacterized membrane protein
LIENASTSACDCHDGERDCSDRQVDVEDPAPREPVDEEAAEQRPSERRPNPALVRQAEMRAQNVQNRLADRITAFAGSMWFVYIHIAWFGCWIGFGVENYPYGC